MRLAFEHAFTVAAMHAKVGAAHTLAKGEPFDVSARRLQQYYMQSTSQQSTSTQLNTLLTGTLNRHADHVCSESVLHAGSPQMC